MNAELPGLEPSTVPPVMAREAAALLALLDGAQRAKICFGFPDEEERQRWFYTPTERGGLPLAEMTAPQQRQAHRLIATGLSAPGYATVATIMGLENVLAAQEGWTDEPYPGRAAPSRRRDPLLYYLSIFGEPGSAAWGWRLGGHHVCLHYTIAGGALTTPTPSFLGANPAAVTLTGGVPARPLSGEEDLARALLHSLDAEQRTAALLSTAAPPDIITENRPRVAYDTDFQPPDRLVGNVMTPEERAATLRRNAARSVDLGYGPEQAAALRIPSQPRGLPATRMTAEQRTALERLLHRYLGRMPAAIARREAARITGTALDAVHFGWAGSAAPGSPHYYRLHAPRLLVEYDNTQDGANHIHTVWRDPEGDFGADLLAQHYLAAH